MQNYKFLLSTVAASFILASCQSRGPVVPKIAVAPKPEPVKVVKVKPKPVGINGKWVPTDANNRKVYYNRFRNGNFVAKSPDGSATIAAGTYKTSPSGDIVMNWYSEAHKAHKTASCKKLSASEMQCTNGDSIFNLRRA
ncbi:MAG: hypothetical protein V3V04_04685 [Rhizobiaceae bacterium]